MKGCVIHNTVILVLKWLIASMPILIIFIKLV